MINKRTHDDLASDVMVLPAFNLIVNIISDQYYCFINSNIIFSNHCIPCISITTGGPPPHPPSVWQCWSSHCTKNIPELSVPREPENVWISRRYFCVSCLGYWRGGARTDCPATSGCRECLGEATSEVSSLHSLQTLLTTRLPCRCAPPWSKGLLSKFNF